MKGYRSAVAVLACAVLAVFCAAGTAQAQPFTHGYSTNFAGGGDGALGNAIYHCKFTIPEDNLPFTVVGVGAVVTHASETPTTDPVSKAALYSVDGATVLDTTEEFSTRATTAAYVPLNFTSHYQITEAGDYNIALWGNLVSSQNLACQLDTTTYDTTWVMTAQAYGGAWPSLSDISGQANRHIVAYIIGIKGDAGIVGRYDTEDTYISSGAADNNYGPGITLSVSATTSALMRPTNLTANLGSGLASIDACTVWTYGSNSFGTDNVACYRVWKTGWGEGTSFNVNPSNDLSATWNDWSNDANEWGTAGCAGADDGGSDNTTDNASSADRMATAEGTEAWTSTAGWHGYEISFGQAMYDGSSGGIILIRTDGTGIGIKASEGASYWPVWQFYTSAAAAGGTPLRRRRDGAGWSVRQDLEHFAGLSGGIDD